MAGNQFEFVCVFFILFDRNPNEPPEPEHGGRQERSRLKNIEWTPYESVHKKYLNLGTYFLLLLLLLNKRIN